MTATIVQLYPTSVAAHGPCRSVAEAIADKLRAGTMTPGAAVAAFRSVAEAIADKLRAGTMTSGAAVAAFRVYGGMEWQEATAEVENILREMTT